MSIILPDFSTAKVLVLGDILLDRYWHGATQRISPEAPVPVVNVTELEERPGGAANVAMNITSLGANAFLLGYTGKDEAAEKLGTLLNSHQVGYQFTQQDNLPTIKKLRVMSRNQQLIRLDFEQDFSGINSDTLHLSFQQQLRDCQVVILSDYAKGTLAEVEKLIALAIQARKPVIVDPKGTQFERYRYATMITPNLHEFEAVVGKVSSQEDLAQKGQKLIAHLSLQALLVTQGENGMTLITQEKEVFHFPSQAREVFDVTGAGDTVIAVLASAFAMNMPLRQAAELANIAAGIVVAKAGTASVTCAEMAAALAHNDPILRGVMDEDKLLTLCLAAKNRGEKIVMTNGCFDILHAGHVEYLEKASKLGHRFIIAVNDDASVSRLKGPTRPLNPVAQRMAILSSLRVVDWVVPFSEDTPARLIEKLSPDILAKGGDYTVAQIAGAAHVLATGGDVKIIPLKPGCSTTGLVEKIQSQSPELQEV